MKKSKRKLSNSHLNQSTTAEPPQKVSFSTKLIVIIIMVLILSSGPLFYIDVPLFYYLFLGLSVLFILIIAFIIMYFTKGETTLFGSQEGYSGDGTAGREMNGESVHNPGLEKLLKAEKRYSRSKTTEKRTTRTLKVKSSSLTETPEGKTDFLSKGHRIGTMPVEDSYYEERIKLKNRSAEDKKKSKKADKVTTFICPDCGGKELYYEAGLISGYKYHCKDCDYIGTFIIEKDFKLD